MEEITVYTDGGARGNPGPSAGAFVVVSNGRVVFKKGEYFGVGTNNQAEYKALLISLKWLLENKGKIIFSRVNFFLDSELVVKQLKKEYKVKSQGLMSLFNSVRDFQKDLKIATSFVAIPREKNKIADALVNITLDKNP